MPVVSISMPESLLDHLDGFIEDHGYSGRSEALREGARGLLQEFDDREPDGERVVCVITVRFDHGSGAAVELSELRHRYEELVRSNVHSHAAGSCLELFVTEGSLEEIGPFVSRLRAVDSVTAVDHSVLPADRPALA